VVKSVPSESDWILRSLCNRYTARIFWLTVLFSVLLAPSSWGAFEWDDDEDVIEQHDPNRLYFSDTEELENQIGDFAEFISLQDFQSVLKELWLILGKDIDLMQEDVSRLDKLRWVRLSQP